MRIIRRKNLTISQKQDVFELWNKEYPKNLQYKQISEFDDYLDKHKDQKHILLIDENDKVKGWYSDFIRNNERWFLTILSSEIQGRKFGTQIIQVAKEENKELNGWVIKADNYIKADGQPYQAPIEFYRKNGFQILDQIQLHTNQISTIKVQWQNRLQQ